MAIDFPSFCPNCGLIFESKIRFGNVQELTMSGNRQQCPRCLAWAELPDGTFNITGDTIEVLSASRLTRERLLRLETILRQAQERHLSPEEATAAVAEEAPALKPLLDRYGPTMRAALLAFLWFVVAALIQQGVSELRDDCATKKEVQQAVEEAIQRSQEEPPRDAETYVS